MPPQPGSQGVPLIVERADIVITQGMPIPEQKIGWIIGKHGSYVKQLEEKSGCSLRISDDTSTEYGITWRYVMMRGTGAALMRCKQLLQIRLDRLPTATESGAAGLLERAEQSEHMMLDPRTLGYR